MLYREERYDGKRDWYKAMTDTGDPNNDRVVWGYNIVYKNSVPYMFTINEMIKQKNYQVHGNTLDIFGLRKIHRDTIVKIKFCNYTSKKLRESRYKKH